MTYRLMGMASAFHIALLVQQLERKAEQAAMERPPARFLP